MARFLKATDIGTGGAQTLPAQYYTAAEIYQLEQQRIFGQHWLCAGRAAEIPERGDYFLRNLGSESVIVVRDDEDAIRAFYNVCRHRGTRLCTQARGQFAKRIHCPYHAWNYALDGRLVGAPSMDDAPGFSKSANSLIPVAVQEWEGFVFMSHSARPEPFEHSFASLIGKFSSYRLPMLHCARRIEYHVRANWKFIVQNYSECYHCPSVHPQLTPLSPADSGANDLIAGPFLGGYMNISQPGGSLTVSGRSCSIPVGDLGREERQRIYYYSLFPNMLLSLHADYVMVHTLWPQSPDRTRVECEWLFHPDARQHAGFEPDDAVQFWDMTNRQDWEMCELSQLGVQSRGYRPSLYAPRESLLAAFDREYLQALGSGEDHRSVD